MLWVFLAVVGAIAAVGGSAAALRRISAARLGDPLLAQRVLGRARCDGPGSGCDEARDRAVRLVHEILAEASPEQALACVDEFVLEIRAALEGQKSLPVAYARISLATGTTAATLALADALGQAPVSLAGGLAGGLAAFAIGAAGAIAAAQLGRVARGRIARVSADYDRLFAHLERVVTERCPLHEVRRHTRSRAARR